MMRRFQESRCNVLMGKSLLQQQPHELELNLACFCGFQNPMDLGTIESKLEGGAYTSPAAVAEDVRLVWRNCRTFNEPGSDVYKSCDELAGFFDQLWKQAKFDKIHVSVLVFRIM
jgi:hypothetical protein